MILNVRAVFLHVVSDSPNRDRLLIPNDRVFQGVPIYYFRTYVGAAGKACKCGLISKTGLFRVLDEAERDLYSKENAKWEPTTLLKGGYPFNKFMKASRRIELENDIENALKINRITRNGKSQFV